MKSIQLNEVSRAFGRDFALHRVSLTFEPGTITVLLGANGAGKSTLMNILATLDQPTSGSIAFDQFDWAEFAKKGRHNIGWVAHKSLVYDELSGRENLEFYASMYGLSDTRKIADTWLERVGISDAAEKRVGEYSRGMRQRLSIARAMIHNPILLLLDEPLTGLDQQGRADMLKLFGQLRDQGRFIVMITHDLDLPRGFVDRVVILRSGSLSFNGEIDDPKQIAERFQEHA